LLRHIQYNRTASFLAMATLAILFPRRIVAEAAAGKSLPSHLGTESGESGSAATALAPASAGTDADTNHESAAGRGHELIEGKIAVESFAV
jgi:hypothetical protein